MCAVGKSEEWEERPFRYIFRVFDSYPVLDFRSTVEKMARSQRLVTDLQRQRKEAAGKEK